MNRAIHARETALLTCMCCPAGGTTWTEVFHFSQCTPTESWGDSTVKNLSILKNGNTPQTMSPVHDLHHGIGPTRHVSRVQVRVRKLPMHQCSIQPCLSTDSKQSRVHTVKGKLRLKEVESKTHLVLETVGCGLVVLRKVREPILCLVCPIYHCTHCVTGCRCMRTSEVVHTTLKSNLSFSTPPHSSQSRNVLEGPLRTWEKHRGLT